MALTWKVLIFFSLFNKLEPAEKICLDCITIPAGEGVDPALEGSYRLIVKCYHCQCNYLPSASPRILLHVLTAAPTLRILVILVILMSGASNLAAPTIQRNVQHLLLTRLSRVWECSMKKTESSSSKRTLSTTRPARRGSLYLLTGTILR